MVQEILKNLYKIEIPLPDNPLKALNSYVIKASDRNLIIDTGWNREECKNAMYTGLGELGVDIKKTDFFITHLHSDHLGLVSELAIDTSIIYFNQPDAERFNSGFPWDEIVHFARLNGYPENELQTTRQTHPGFKFRSKENLAFHMVQEGDTVSFGDYVFKCVETPGHSWGHMCLYEPYKKIFVAGDHILNDITPTIQLWSDDRNPLKEYLESLGKVYKLDIELVLPGHRSIFSNYRERIQELKDHHQERAEEVLSILESGSQTAFEVASQMQWDIVYDSWDFFPVSQKWFAVGEAIAHLKYLEEKGMVRKEIQGQKRLYLIQTK